MAEKTLNIQISSADLGALKTSGYSLCLAKKMDGYDFNVVWHACTDFFASNTFSWTPVYELFCSRQFLPGAVVQESVTAVPISLGQQSTLDANGILSPAVNGGLATALTMINDYGSINPGVNQSARGIDGATSSDPIFLTDTPVLLGIAELTPTELIMAWFQQDVQTGTMFKPPPPTGVDTAKKLVAKTNATIVDFSLVNQKTILYQNQRWSTQS